MRNLKRVLSLALALVMVLGMMVITTSAAAYTDADEITYEEAVAVMSGVGLFEGNPDGSFKPTEILTRKQAATLMARITLGEKIADGLIATKQIFSDVAVTAWYAPYVEYCYNAGMINGMGDGTFAPDATLTGTQFAKLLLCAIGYDAGAQGYTGTGWASNINNDALTEGLIVDGAKITDPVTRELAAQMVLQIVNNDTVKYTTAYDYATGANVVIGPNPTGVKFMAKYFPGLGYNNNDGVNDWGEPWDYKWTYNGKTLWTTAYTPVLEYFTAVDECDIVKDLGTDEDTAYTAYVDGKDNKDVDEWDATGKGYSMTGTGVWTRIYDTKDLGYVAVAINTYFGKVTKVITEQTDKNGHITREAAIELDVYEKLNEATEYTYLTDGEYKKGEAVLVAICNGEVASVEAAEYETETVKRITYKKAPIMDTVTAKDGDVYAENVKFNYIYDASTKDFEDELDTKTEYNLYLDEQGNIIAAVIPAPEADTYMYGVITRINWVDTNDDDIDGYAKVNVVDMDAEDQTALELTEYNGKELEYADKDEDPNPADATVSTNRQYNKAWHDNLYEYTLNKKTDSYEVTDVAATAEVYELTADTRFEVEEDGEYYRANNATKFLIKTGKTEYESYTGWKNVPELTANAAGTKAFEAQYFVGKNDYLSYVFIDATGLIWAGEAEVVYITDTTLTAEDDDLFAFEAFVGTDKEEYILADGVELDGTGLFELSFNADGEVIAVDAVSDKVWYELAVDGTEEGVMMVLDDEFEDFDIDDVPFYAIDGKRIVEGAADEVGEELNVLTNAKGDKLIAVYYVVEG